MINYLLLTKPGIILGNLLTVTAGFLLASKGKFDPLLFFSCLIGLVLIIASASVFNNYINHQSDKKMERTKNRPLVVGLISKKKALLFGTCLGIIGNLTLLLFTNLLTLAVADVGFFIYVIIYSFWKGRTIYGTAIGSIAGAVPPVVGYCAVSNHLDAAALILFAMMILWQMPHFFAIALHHFEDYAQAEVPVLPVVKGMFRTKIHMVGYIICFTLMASLLTLLNYTGYFYLILTVIVGLAWLGLCLKGFKTKNDQNWGKEMFRFSLLVILSICLTIPFDIAT